MRAPTVRLALLGFAVAILLAAACADPPECGEPPDCDRFECVDHPACTANGQTEICDNGLDDDGDGLIDAEDPACVDAISPPDGTHCAGQDTATTAGDDSDSLIDPSDCEDPVGSDSGDGDTSLVTISTVAGVVAVRLAITENEEGGPPPTARVTIETETAYEPGGDHSFFSQFNLSDGDLAAVSTTCESQGFGIEVNAVREWIPTSPAGGSYTCTTNIDVSGDGSPTSTFHFLLGAGLADDGDGDGVANANDKYCPNSVGAVDESGCALHGTYPPNFAWFCNTAPPAGVCAFDPPTPGFCQDCTVVVDDVEVSAPFVGHVATQAGDALVCQNCELDQFSLGWALSCGSEAECSRFGNGALGVDQRGGDYRLEIGTSVLTGGEGGVDQLVVDPDALAIDDPNVVTIDVTTTDADHDLAAEFEITTGGRSYTRTIETFGGVGQSRIQLVFDGAAAVTWQPIPGWEFDSHDCPGEGATAEVTTTRGCLFRLARLETGDRIPLTQSGIEIANAIASNFGDLGLGELFSVSGANGVGVYRADTFGLVPSLSQIGSFLLTNVLGSLHLDLAGFPNDGFFYYRTGSGTGIRQYFPDIPGFGATLVSNAAVSDATYVDGDPSLGRGVFTTANGISALSFEDFGGSHPFLTSNPVVFGAPSGFSFTSAFQTSASSNVLVAARNAIAGENGRLFVATGSTPAAVIGDLGEDPRLLRCATAVPETWICVVANFESGDASVVTWDGDATAAVVGTIATGPNPLVPGVAAASGEVRVLFPSFTGDTATAVRLDGATGAEIARESYALPPGAFASSALVLGNGSTGVVTLSGTDEIQIIRSAFSF